VKLDFLVTLATGVIAYLPSVFAAIIIIVVGLFLGNLVKKLLESILQGPHFGLLSSVAKYAIIAISIFMALDQLGVAKAIVNAAFILILGGLSLAFGLAFGLGGKDFASKYLNRLDNKIEQTTVDKSQLHKAKEEAADQMEQKFDGMSQPNQMNQQTFNPGPVNPLNGQNPELRDPNQQPGNPDDPNHF
jgi:hypothetical protein